MDYLQDRIDWVHEQLKGTITQDQSINFQWLLTHLTTIQEGKRAQDF